MEGGGNLHTIEQLYLDKYIVFNNGIIVRPRYYSSDIINRYFQYRLFRFKCLDHGIIGADKLMDGLIENYCSKFKQCIVQTDFNNFVYENKHYCVDQFRIFAYICDCIASHNIWYASNAKSKKEYKDFGLYALLARKNRKIKYKENPLLFLLCLADSLEPVKRGNGSDA